MSKGNGVFVAMLMISVMAEALDHSPEPILLVLANLWEVMIIALGVWKGIELIAQYKTKGK